MSSRVLATASVGLLLVSGLQAQTATGGAAIPGKQVAPAKSVEDLVDVFEGEMMRAARAMPADRYGFTPASLHIAGATFDGVRTFAEEVKHVTQSNYINAATVSGTEPTVDLKALDRLKTKDEIVAALADSFAAVHRAIATITPANGRQAVDDAGVGPNATRESEAAWVAVHGSDHYGQMVEYLRMNGIVLSAK